MEKDYHSKLKYSKETVDEQIKEACRGILKEKDDEINKLGIKVGLQAYFFFNLNNKYTNKLKF